VAIGISDVHIELAGVARSFLVAQKAREASRSVLDSPEEVQPAFWEGMVELGWPGLHVAEAYGGSGYELTELLVVVEELGHAIAPGQFVPTVVVSAIVNDLGDDSQRSRWLPALVGGGRAGAFSLKNQIRSSAGKLSGDAIVILGAGRADVVALVVGDDVVMIEPKEELVEVRPAPSIDLTRRSAVVHLRDLPLSRAGVIKGAAPRARALARTIVSAEAVGGAQLCVEMASAYAKERQQFGRPIAMFQAVKHHCADMLVAAEMATAAVWDAGRAASGGDAGQFELAAAICAARSLPAFVRNAESNIQVHGGIGFTWEHDGHLLLRRSVALASAVDAADAEDEVATTALSGVRRQHSMDLPPEAEAFRPETLRAAEELAGLGGDELRERLIDTGYVQPHWPKPWGRAAPALEQLVIDEEFAKAGVARPDFGITGWVILTLIQHGTEDQVSRWVRPTLEGKVVWCQLFSEPDAGSDAAGIRTRAERTDGGWLVSGQKVWTSAAQLSHRGLATVRTDPDKPKHAGISTMVIDMHAEGVEVRPLREATGNALFNEVFFDHVFVPDDDVVGHVDDGWTVARATLGNERVSIGGSTVGMGGPDMVELLRRHRPDDVVLRRELGALLAERESLAAVNLRRVQRTLVGAGPGPEGNVTKLLSAEHGQRVSDFRRRVVGTEGALMEGDGLATGLPVIFSRALTIAGGTSEITRNQIGERILGLPRDPLLK
jgi:alkylation response protein AidB-like acyl-CoA dehydrogenase